MLHLFGNLTRNMPKSVYKHSTYSTYSTYSTNTDYKKSKMLTHLGSFVGGVILGLSLSFYGSTS